MIRSLAPNTAARLVTARWLATAFIAAGWLGMFVSPTRAQLPTTQLDSIFPPGGKQGTSVDVTVRGGTQDDVRELIFSHPGITAEQKTTEHEFLPGPRPVDGQFTVKIAANVAPGTYEARAVGRFGASNPRAFVVGSEEELQDAGQNRTPETAMEIKPGQVVNGRVDGSNVDYFKLTLQQGQRVLVDCLGERIDSKIDGTLVIHEPSGRELVTIRDVEGRDPVLDFTAPAAGEYLIGVYDFLYDGGADYVYRLSVHDRPHIDFVMPPAGVAGAAAQFTLYGRNLPGGKPVDGLTTINGVPLEQATVTVNMPGDEASLQRAPVGEFLPMVAIFQDGIEYQVDGSNTVRIGFASAPVVMESADNDDPAKAQQVSAPCEIAGQFYPARDTDWFQFDAKKGEVYWIDVTSHQLGLDSDPYLIIQKVTKNAEGVEQVADVAQVDDPGNRNAKIGSDYDTTTDDPSYKLQVSEDATYRIAVRDQFGSARSDPRLVYRLAIRPEQPGLRLIAYPEQPLTPNNNAVSQFSAVLRKGGTTVIKTVLERRDGFDGEVEIGVEGLPAGVKCSGAVLAGAVDTAWLVLEAEENAAEWAGSIRVFGKATIDGKQVTRYARTGTCVWGTGNRQQAAPYFRVTRDIELSVCGELDQALVQAGDGNVIETSRGGKIEVPIKIARRGEFKGDLKLVANGLPNEIKPGDVTVKGDAADGKLELIVNNAQAKPGTYTFVLRADTPIKYARNPDAITRAEEEQKLLAEAVTAATEATKKATEERDAANKAAQESDAAFKQAEQAKAAADKALQAADEAGKEAAQKAADEAAKAVEEAKAKLEAAKKAQTDMEAALKAAQDKQKRATDAKTAADKNLDAVKKANAANNLNVAFMSTPIKLRVVDTPLEIAMEPVSLTVKQGEKTELPVKLGKKYGFDESTEISIETPNGVAGLNIGKQTIAKGQDATKLELAAAANATPGQHTLTVRAKAKFNNVDVTTTQPVTLTVEKVEPAK
ncbi:MAG: PPC domain-containing protein [Planctomycetales bacterium]|nr:PPC domain-containing protein [Planctomycetales bacterium]